jgi:hypothetical protein
MGIALDPLPSHKPRKEIIHQEWSGICMGCREHWPCETKRAIESKESK